MAQAVELIEAVEETGMVYAYAENYCYMKHAFEMWQRYQEEISARSCTRGQYIRLLLHIPRITSGEKHWRNRTQTFCTHSLSPAYNNSDP